MLHTSAHRACCYLFFGLAIVIPLTVHGEIKLAPIIDLNPQHLAPASKDLKEPEPLVVAAQAIPLADSGAHDAESNRNAQSVIQPLSPPTKTTRPDTSQQAIALAAPFDPTAVRQHSFEQDAKVVTLAPIIRTKAPIRERILPPMPLKTKQVDLSRAMAPEEQLVHRTVFVATTGDRLQRTFQRQLPILRRHDRTTKQILAALSDMTRDERIDRKAEIIATAKSADGNSLHERRTRLSGLIQLADKDPIAQRDDASLEIPRKPLTTSKTLGNAKTPIIVQATKPMIELARREARTDIDAELDSSHPENAKSFATRSGREIAEDVEKRTAIVELVANPLAQQDATEQQTFAAPEANMDPIVKPAVDTLALKPLAESSSDGMKTAGLAREAVVAFAETAPLLARLQEQSPSASDLPAPHEEPPLTAEEIAEAEEIEAIESDLKPIQAVSAMTRPEAGEMPKNYAARRFAQEGEVMHRMGHSRTRTESQMMWEAPAIAHRPLYFEDINLERHGYKIPIVQPAVSAAHFFGRVPLLPYLAASERHRKPQYTLGHYRPGDYAPYSLYVPRLKLDGSIAEAVFMTGIMFAFP